MNYNQLKMLLAAVTGVMGLIIVLFVLGMLDMRQKCDKCDATVALVASAMASARTAAAPSAPKRQELHETLCFMVLTPRGREDASERCRQRGGRPDSNPERVICYGTGAARYQKLFVYTAVDAISDDTIAGGGGAAP